MRLRHPQHLLITVVRDKLLRELFEVDHPQRHRVDCRQFHGAQQDWSRESSLSHYVRRLRAASHGYAFRSLKMARTDAEQVRSEGAIRKYQGVAK